MAGSKKRTNIQGNVVMGDPAVVMLMRRLSSGELTQIFLHAKEQGQAPVMLGDHHYTLLRHPDHTFSLQSEDAGHIVF